VRYRFSLRLDQGIQVGAGRACLLTIELSSASSTMRNLRLASISTTRNSAARPHLDSTRSALGYSLIAAQRFRPLGARRDIAAQCPYQSRVHGEPRVLSDLLTAHEPLWNAAFIFNELRVRFMGASTTFWSRIGTMNQRKRRQAGLYMKVNAAYRFLDDDRRNGEFLELCSWGKHSQATPLQRLCSRLTSTNC